MDRISQGYEEYFNIVYGYLMTLTGGNLDLAEELTQETFYRATKNIKKFRGDCKISSWLCQIAKFTYYQNIDKGKRRMETSLDDSIEIPSDVQIEQQIIDNETKLKIYKKIQELESPMRDVVMLRLSGDLSFKEIGDIMNQSESWARVTFYRAKQKLGKELK